MSWPLVELGSIAAVSWGNTSITKESYCASGFPAFSAAGEDGFLENYENDCDGIVLSAIGARCGRCFKASGKWTAIKNTITILEKTQGGVCLQYLFHFLSRDNVWPSRGGAQPFIALGDARRVKVPLPPLSEQKRIAAILDKADAIRRKRQQAIQLADDFLRAVFLDMFGDPVSNPKGWPKKSLKLLGKSATGRTPPGEKVDMWGEGLPFVTPGDLCGQVDSSVREVTREGAEYSKICRKGSLLVCCIGTVGKVGIAGRSLAFNQQINAQEWGSEISDIYGFFVFKLSPGLVSSKAIQTTLPILKKSLFDEIEIPVPPIGLQEKFSAIAKKVSESSLRHESGLNTPLFESLSQLAFSGQLQIRKSPCASSPSSSPTSAATAPPRSFPSTKP